MAVRFPNALKFEIKQKINFKKIGKFKNRENLLVIYDPLEEVHAVFEPVHGLFTVMQHLIVAGNFGHKQNTVDII